MIISNLLLIPGTGDTATEIFRALRYEKTVRLYASIHGANKGNSTTMPHRMAPFRPLPEISDEIFPLALAAAVKHAAIDYIVPTTPEARAFFKHHTNIAEILDTGFDTVPTGETGTGDTIIDCYSNKQHAPVYCKGRQIAIGSDGIREIWQSKTLTPEQQNLLETTAREHGLTGAWSLVLNDSTSPVSIIPYFTPEMGIHRANGVNFMLLMLHEARGNPIEALPIGALTKLSTHTKAISLGIAYKQVFLDLDDTLIVKGSTNDTVVAFIYQCQKNGIPVHLITRHFQKPTLTLCEFGIAENLFESIIWIKDQTAKSFYMKNAEDALFIDDAFSERKEVSTTSPHIPCLPPESLEALMVTL